MSPAIEVRGVSKSFRSVRALIRIDLEIPPGNIFALVGPNGAGKTTLLKILAGLLLPDQGSARIEGPVSLTLSEGRSFYMRLTPRQNLEFFAALYGLSGPQARERIRRTAEQMGFTPSLDRPYEQLSTGTRQRVAIARSFLNEAPVLLLDEPTRGLDPLAKRELRGFLKQLSRERGRTLLLATHDLSEAAELADRIGVLHEGRLLKVERREAFCPNGSGKEGLETALAALCRGEVLDVP